MGLGARVRALADVRSVSSASTRMRDARFELFRELLDGLPRPVRVLDVGGTNGYWARRGLGGAGDELDITIANAVPQPRYFENIRSVVVDATDMHTWDDGAFDVVFSNSTIEHLFTWEAQVAMASEVRRLAPAYYVQTPSFWFPLEPHYLVPGWQWLPRSLRVEVLTRRRVGHRGPMPRAAARESVAEIRLLTTPQMRRLFPDADVVPERVGPLVKSMTAIRRP